MTLTNEGILDRVIRIIVGFAMGYLAWINWPGTLSIVWLVIGAVPFVTGIVGWCAEYALLGISTKKVGV